MRLQEEKGAESKGQLGRCFHSRRTQTPQAGVTRQETVSCVPQVIRTAFYSRPAAVLGQAGLKRRGRRQKELGWLPLGTEKVSSRYTGPRTLLQNTLYLEAARSTSKFSRSGRRAPAAWLPLSRSRTPRPAWGDLSMAQKQRESKGPANRIEDCLRQILLILRNLTR